MLQGATALLKPTTYIDGKIHCILLGTDPNSGIYGRGRMLEKASEKWHKQLQNHLAESNDEDYVVAYIKSVLDKAQVRQIVKHL